MTAAPWILSIQSHVAYGHAGNSSAIFPLQRMGFEVAAIHTVQFSNHTGYGAWQGQVFEPSLIADCVQGLEERNVLKDMQAFVSGYLGSPDTAHVIADTAQKVKKANPLAIYCADPVMGDIDRGIYVHPDIPEVIKSEIIPLADILTPNHFELETLTNQKITNDNEAIKAMESLQNQGAKTVALTSFEPSDAPSDTIQVLIKNHDECWKFSAPKVQLKQAPVGTGDCFSALLLAHTLKGCSLSDSLNLTATGVWEILDTTQKAGTWEIQTIAAQERFTHPNLRFNIKKL
ncbi:MAG: pyridoxal kinase PdxY [Alphaproteobacteria bacterium]